MTQNPSGWRNDPDELPPRWPGHQIPDDFMMELGRSVATFGALEFVIKRTIFALTATEPREKVTDRMVENWIRTRILPTLSGTLGQLVDTLRHELKRAKSPAIPDWERLMRDLDDLTQTRNILCHGHWVPSDTPDFYTPSFISHRDGEFDGEFSVAGLRKIREDTVAAACECMDLVTLKGYNFPGQAGPGRDVLDRAADLSEISRPPS